MSKKRYSIRNPKSFRHGARKNAGRVNKIDSKIIDQKIKEKKADIRNFIEKSVSDGILERYQIVRETRRSLWIQCRVINRINPVELRFFFWTENNKPKDQANSNIASFFIKLGEGVKEKKRKALKYLQGIQRGSATEDLTAEALGTLKSSEEEIYYFRPAKISEDRDQGKDFIVGTLKNGIKIEVPIQVKSSKKDLNEHQKKHPQIPGLYREFEGGIDNQIEIIKQKIIKIIRAYKQNKIIFV